MKVLVVFNHPAPYKVRLFNELSKYFELFVIFERKKERSRTASFYNEEITCPHMFLDGISFGDANHYSRAVIKHLKTHKYDLIIMNGYSTLTEIVTINYLNKNKIPYCLYINGGCIKEETKLKRKIKTNYIRSAATYLSPSVDADDYLVYYGAKREKIYHYPYSTLWEKEIVNAPLTKKEKTILREKLRIPDRATYISVGSFIKRKNLFELIKLWREKEIKHTLVLIGGGEEKEEYLKYIQENNLNNIFIYDFMKREQLFEYMRASDAFIFFTRQDIYGHVINEAMSQGLPVISTDLAIAAKNLIKIDHNGYIFSLDDKNTFLKDIERITPAMAKNAIITSHENTIENMIKKHVEIINEIGARK